MANDSQAPQSPHNTAAAEPEPLQIHSLKFQLLLWGLYVFCRVLSATWRIRVSGMDRRRRAVASGRTNGILIASFHENAAAGVLSHQGQPICQMISRSKDGEMVAFIGEKMGYLPIRGSSSRGAKEARDAMVAAVAAGHIGAGYVFTNQSGELDYSRAAVQLAEAAAQLRAIQQLRKKLGKG